MGYAICLGFCIACKRQIAFNPRRVPSVRVRNGRPDPEGTREPLCRDCADLLNDRRKAEGLPEVTIPADAYEACEETQLLP